MWGKNVAFTVIRPQRFTHELIDGSSTFSLSFFDGSFRDKLGYFGSVSGRDEDKIAKSGLTVLRAKDAPYFAEAKSVVLCRKLYAQAYLSACFVDSEPDRTWYPDKDYHTQYIGEITGLLTRR